MNREHDAWQAEAGSSFESTFENGNETVELFPSQFSYGDRIYVYSLTGGTDNGSFSQQVFVNGHGPKYPIGGPIDTLLSIPASAYSTTDAIKFPMPARSVQYVLVEPGTHVGVKDQRTIAKQFRLNQNYPNPFNPTTTISYDMPKASLVTLKVYDALGREVAILQDHQSASAGKHQVAFDASNLPSGIYFYRLQAGNFIQTNKMTLIK